MNKKRILIVDDETININMLIGTLEDEYDIRAVKNGEQALKRAEKILPDLILLDILMPEMDGYEVCQQLKANPKTAEIPIVFITGKSEVGDETKGFQLGAADYITKPFSPPIVKARVKNHLKLRESMVNLQAAMCELERLYSMALDANPMTKLPGNNSVAARIETALQNNEKACVIYTDLDNFKAFNDKYGFAMGDKAILYTCQVFKDAIIEAQVPNAFIGHIGGDDFVVIVPSDKAQLTADSIIYLFDKEIAQFYKPEDVAAGCIESINRQGEKETFPLMSISLAGVDLSLQTYSQYVEVNDACAETKKMAKAISGSSFFMDRRTKL